MTSVESELVQFENWTLRVRAPQKKEGARILLMIHGWKGDENSMWVFARQVPENYWVLAPRAPFQSDSGYSWRAPAAPGWPQLDFFRASAEGVMTLLDRWGNANSVDATQPVDVIGFSQGAVMTITLGTLFPSRIRKMGMLSGFAPLEMEKYLSPNHFAGKTIFVAHGTQDETVPIDMARTSIKLLEEYGSIINYCEAPVGHKVSAECMRALGGYLSD